VLDIHLLVAFVALTNRLFGRLVRIVAALAWHRGMHGKPLDPFGLERPMATRAVPSSEHLGLRAENVARVAIHGHTIEVDVGQRRLILVALRAHPGIHVVKAFLGRVVTFVALETFVDHVLRVAGGKAHLGPVVRHGAGGPRCALFFHRWNHVRGERRVQEPAHEPHRGENPDDNRRSLHRPPT